MTNPTLAHGAMPELPVVVAFLQGEGPLDGVWFGEEHPTERGNFWWRKYLRAAIQQACAAVPEGKWMREGMDKVDLIMQLAEDYADEALNHGLYAPATYEARDRLRSALSSPQAAVKDASNHGLVTKHGQVNHEPDSGHLSAVGVSDARLWELRRQAKDDPRCSDQHWFILFARAVIAEARIARSPELSCWFRNCTCVEECADSGCKALAAAPEVNRDQVHSDSGGSGVTQPLRGERIYEIFAKVLPNATGGMKYVPEWAVPVTRAIEAAHGIKEAS